MDAWPRVADRLQRRAPRAPVARGALAGALDCGPLTVGSMARLTARAPPAPPPCGHPARPANSSLVPSTIAAHQTSGSAVSEQTGCRFGTNGMPFRNKRCPQAPRASGTPSIGRKLQGSEWISCSFSPIDGPQSRSGSRSRRLDRNDNTDWAQTTSPRPLGADGMPFQHKRRPQQPLESDREPESSRNERQPLRVAACRSQPQQTSTPEAGGNRSITSRRTCHVGQHHSRPAPREPAESREPAVPA